MKISLMKNLLVLVVLTLSAQFVAGQMFNDRFYSIIRTPMAYDFNRVTRQFNVPTDTLSTADISAIAFKNNKFWGRYNDSWRAIEGSGGITNGNKFDIFVSGDGDTLRINNDAITTLKIMNAAVTDAKLDYGLNAQKIGSGSVDNTTFNYISTLSSNAQTQIDGKQATLISGTNIKTVNGQSLLGSGNINISGGAGGGAAFIGNLD